MWGRRGGGGGAEDDQDGDTAGVEGYSSSDERRHDGGEAAMRLSAAMRHRHDRRWRRTSRVEQQQQQRPSPCQSALSTGRRPAQRRRKRGERPHARKWCEMRGDTTPVDERQSCTVSQSGSCLRRGSVTCRIESKLSSASAARAGAAVATTARPAYDDEGGCRPKTPSKRNPRPVHPTAESLNTTPPLHYLCPSSLPPLSLLPPPSHSRSSPR